MIYFAQREPGKPIKIGFTENLRLRMLQLRGLDGRRVEPIALMPGGLRRERALHRLFRRFLIRNEWHRPAQEILTFIAENNVPEPTEDEGTLPTALIVQSLIRLGYGAPLVPSYERIAKATRDQGRRPISATQVKRLTRTGRFGPVEMRQVRQVAESIGVPVEQLVTPMP